MVASTRKAAEKEKQTIVLESQRISGLPKPSIQQHKKKKKKKNPASVDILSHLPLKISSGDAKRLAYIVILRNSTIQHRSKPETQHLIFTGCDFCSQRKVLSELWSWEPAPDLYTVPPVQRQSLCTPIATMVSMKAHITVPGKDSLSTVP
jgi:hypothetical protein